MRFIELLRIILTHTVKMYNIVCCKIKLAWDKEQLISKKCILLHVLTIMVIN